MDCPFCTPRTYADPKSFVRGGPTLIRVFLVEEGRKYPNTTISGPPSKRFLNGMAFRWRVNDDPILNADLVVLRFVRGSGPVLQRNPIYLDPRIKETSVKMSIMVTHVCP